jgi:hypothetical protein
VAQDLETHINLLRGRGQPLPESVRAFFEPRFGYDFSRVRIHTDVQSAELARALNARAFTVGQDVVFGVRQYAPWTILGRRLLAHELVHVIQQTGRGIAFGERPGYLQCSNDKDGFWYIVKSGDYLDGIAKGNGLLSWKDIYYHKKTKCTERNAKTQISFTLEINSGYQQTV